MNRKNQSGEIDIITIILIVVVMATVVFIVFGLTSAKDDCLANNGEWSETAVILMPVSIDKITTLQPVPVYGCKMDISNKNL